MSLPAGDGFWNVGKEYLGVLDHFLDEPGEAEDEDADHGDDCRDEGDGLILDLGACLGEADQEADEAAGQEDWRAEQQSGEHRLLREIDGVLGVHGTKPRPLVAVREYTATNGRGFD